MRKKKEKKIQWRALLISFGITCVMLGIVIGLSIWYMNNLSGTGRILWKGDAIELIIGNGIAFLIMFAILYHFIKKPKKNDQQESWKG